MGDTRRAGRGLSGANVRLRAERRAGELLKELARADLAETGKASREKQLGLSNGATTPSPYAATLNTMRMSRQQAHRFQSLANVDEREFEAAFGVTLDTAFRFARFLSRVGSEALGFISVFRVAKLATLLRVTAADSAMHRLRMQQLIRFLALGGEKNPPT